jgi:hypothetical protein
MATRFCRAGVLLGFVILPAAGCYRYEPITDPYPGMEVRARLQTEAAVRRSAGLDEPIMRYEGRVVGTTPETVTLDVLLLRDPSVFRDVEIRDTVRLSRSEIESITQRRISTTRSLVFAGAAGVGAWLVIRGIVAVVGGNEGGEGENGPAFTATPDTGPQPTIRLLRVHLPRR